MQLTEIKMNLLRAVEEAGGCEHTETLYKRVEGGRLYEIGVLERSGFLVRGEDGTASLTEKGRMALECPGCRIIGMNPTHNGSRLCESGSIASGGNRAHCTCDTCF